MADLYGKRVVWPQTPKRRAAVLAAGMLIAVAVLYATFEFGRYEAGFRVVDSMRGALLAAARIRDLEAQNARQREERETADVGRRVDREGYQQVEQSLGDMQSQIGRLQQDLSFYRGLVQPDSVVHVKVQTLQIVPAATSGQYGLKFVLMQTGKPEKSVSGTVAVAIDGTYAGKPAALSLYQVSPAHRGGLVYSFRYFQNYNEPVQLPTGFEPTRVDMEIHAGKDATHRFRQSFVWKAQGMSTEAQMPGEATGSVGNGESDGRTQTE